MQSYRLFLRYAAYRTGNPLCVSDKRVSLGYGICRVAASGTSRPVCALVGLFQCCGFLIRVVCARTSIAVSLGNGRRSRERSWRGWSRKCHACLAHCLQNSAHIFLSADLKRDCTAPICKRAEEAPPCGGGHTFTPLGHFRGKDPTAEDPPVAEVILSHPFGGTKVDLMERECWIHKDKNRKVIVLMPPSRGRDTLLFALGQIFFSRKENPTDVPKTFPFALKQAYFADRKSDGFPKNILSAFQSKSFLAERKPLRTFRKMFPLLSKAK